MQISPRKHRAAFRPVDNINSTQKPQFDTFNQTRNLPRITNTTQPNLEPAEDTLPDISGHPYLSSLIPDLSSVDQIGNSSSLFDEAYTQNARLSPSPKPYNRTRAEPKTTIEDKHRYTRIIRQDSRPQRTMVKERQAPDGRPTEAPAPKAVQGLTNTSPEFGKASPLRNPLRKNGPSDGYSNLFNPNKARPELHRDTVRQPSFNKTTAPANGTAPASRESNPYQSATVSSSTTNNPFVTNSGAAHGRPTSSGSDLYEIPASQFYTGHMSHTQRPSAPRPPSHSQQPSYGSNPNPVALPTNAPLPTIPPIPRPLYSTTGANGFKPVNYDNGFGGVRKTVILDDIRPKKHVNDDEEDDDDFNPDAAIRAEGDKFGAPDIYGYVDQSKANENIKALLEGALDDDDEKIPRTRLRRKKKLQKVEEEATNALAKKLQALEVKDEEPVEEEEEEEEDDGSVEGMKVKLLPHQVDGVSWMIEKETGAMKKKGKLTKGGILADDMGLGKTIQSIALILSNPRPDKDFVPENPRIKISPTVGKGTLIVAPLALIKQWESEIKTKLEKSHALKVLVHHGSNRAKSADKLKGYDVVITTYQCLTSEHSNSNESTQTGCFGVHWYRVILDEAHTIKNRNAKCTKACYDIRAQYRWCLTGTPMQNNLDELQSLIKFLRVKPYDSLPEWKNSITGPMKNGRGNLAMRRLQIFLKVFMKRRTKDVLKKEGALNFGGKNKEGEDKGGFKIVARNIETIIGEFTSAEREFYDRLSNRAEERLAELMGGEKHSYIGALVLLLRLRQACNHPNLTRSNVKEDKDALTTGATKERGPAGLQTPRRGQQNSQDDMDDLADILGGLTVQTKRCDVCQVKLTSGNATMGGIRCDECENDLLASQKKLKKDKKRDKKHRKDKKKHRKNKDKHRPAKVVEEEEGSETEQEEESVVVKSSKVSSRQRPVITDSDDDEEEGEWLVPEDQQKDYSDLGKAGGTDDENAEGGGDTLDSIDSNSFAGEEDDGSKLDSFIVHDTDEDEEDEEGPVVPRGKGKKKVINLVSSDEESGAESEADNDEDDDSNDSNDTTSGSEDSEDSEQSDTESDSDSDSISYTASSLTPSTKIRQLLQILEKETPDHKVIVFSQFTSMLDLIEPFLRRAEYKFTRYDGSMRNELREASLEKLRNDEGTRVLLCSLKCGSLGLNLTAASRVVIMEPFWNPVSLLALSTFPG